MDKNRVLIIGGERPELDLELIQKEIVEALVNMKGKGELITEVHYLPSLSSEQADGFIVFCVPSLYADPKLFYRAVIRGLESAYPDLFQNERFSIVSQEQTRKPRGFM